MPQMPANPAATCDPAEAGFPDGNLIVFDGICVFCSGFARFMARHDIIEEAEWASETV